MELRADKEIAMRERPGAAAGAAAARSVDGGRQRHRSERDRQVVVVSPTRTYDIEIRVQALKRAYGLLDHYYMIIDNQEYHPGYYGLGNILPLGTTKGYHVVCKKRLCFDCYNKIILDFNMHEDKRISQYYPFLNCESLCTGISSQAMAFVALPFVGLLFFQGKFLYAIVLALAVLVLFLALSKYVFSRTSLHYCRHAYINESANSYDARDDNKGSSDDGTPRFEEKFANARLDNARTRLFLPPRLRRGDDVEAYREADDDNGGDIIIGARDDKSTNVSVRASEE